MDQLYFQQPFGFNGDRTPVLFPVDPGGGVTFNAGYPLPYELDLATDPSARAIERAKMNYLFFVITQQLQQYQMIGTPEFIDTADNGGSPFAYANRSRVRYFTVSTGTWSVYESLIDNNTDTPGLTVNWRVVRAFGFDDFKASLAQAQAGTNDGTYVTPLGLAGVLGGMINRDATAIVATVTGNIAIPPEWRGQNARAWITGGGGGSGGGGGGKASAMGGFNGSGGGGGGGGVGQTIVIDFVLPNAATIPVVCGVGGQGGGGGTSISDPGSPADATKGGNGAAGGTSSLGAGGSVGTANGGTFGLGGGTGQPGGGNGWFMGQGGQGGNGAGNGGNAGQAPVPGFVSAPGAGGVGGTSYYGFGGRGGVAWSGALPTPISLQQNGEAAPAPGAGAGGGSGGAFQNGNAGNTGGNGQVMIKLR